MADRAPLNILLVILAAVPLVFTVVNFVLAHGNQTLRAEVDRRQYLIDQNAQLARVNQVLLQQVAIAAVKNQDSRLRELLSRNGITINAPATPPADRGKGG
jgi:hypothetical protein